MGGTLRGQEQYCFRNQRLLKCLESLNLHSPLEEQSFFSRHFRRKEMFFRGTPLQKAFQRLSSGHFLLEPVFWRSYFLSFLVHEHSFMNIIQHLLHFRHLFGWGYRGQQGAYHWHFFQSSAVPSVRSSGKCHLLQIPAFSVTLQWPRDILVPRCQFCWFIPSSGSEHTKSP